MKTDRLAGHKMFLAAAALQVMCARRRYRGRAPSFICPQAHRQLFLMLSLATILCGLRPAYAQTERVVKAPTESSLRQSALAVHQDAEVVDIPTLVRDANLNMAAMIKKFVNYSYLHQKVLRKINKRGEVKDEEVLIYESYPSGKPGAFIHVLVRKNGVPLSPERVAKERERARKELKKALAREAQRSSLGDADWATRAAAELGGMIDFQVSEGNLFRSRGFSFSIPPFLIFSKFHTARSARFQGRDAVVLNFIPSPYLLGRNASARVLLRLGGVVWIDAVERVVMRLEAWPVEEVEATVAVAQPSPRPDAPVVFEQVRLPDGIWVPSLAHINTFGREKTFEGIKADVTISFSDFKLFNSENGNTRWDGPEQVGNNKSPQKHRSFVYESLMSGNAKQTA